MGKTRTCGQRCHQARGNKCRCWCGGLFHGAGGADARQSFADQFGAVPMREAEFTDTTRQLDLFDDAATRAIRESWRLAREAAITNRGFA